MCRVTQEREIHRKISTGGIVVEPVESGTLPEPRLSTISDRQEVNKEEQAGVSPTTEQADHVPKEADSVKAENPIPETAGNESRETKESVTSDTAGASTVGKTEVEVVVSAKVEQSEGQGEPEVAKDVLLQQDSTPQPQDTAPKEDTEAQGSPTKVLEVSKEPAAISTEPKVDSAAAGASLETDELPSEPSSAVPAETGQPTAGGEVTEQQGSDQPSSSAEPPTMSPSSDSQTDMQLPLLSSSGNSRPVIVSPAGDSQTEGLSYITNSLTEKLLSSS